MQKNRILCVDSDQNTLDVLTLNLEAYGYQTVTASVGKDVSTADVSLVILDLQLSDMSGFDLLKKLRSTSTVPIMVLSALSDDDDIVQALTMGADDYMTKPFSTRELIARVKALLRRCADYPEEDIIRVGPLLIDSGSFAAYRNGEKLSLTLKEYELLKVLAEAPGKVLTRDFLLDRIWGYEFYGEARTVDVYISQIRVKLGDDANMIETVRGIGYKMNSTA